MAPKLGVSRDVEAPSLARSIVNLRSPLDRDTVSVYHLVMMNDTKKCSKHLVNKIGLLVSVVQRACSAHLANGVPGELHVLGFGITCFIFWCALSWKEIVALLLLLGYDLVIAKVL